MALVHPFCLSDLSSNKKKELGKTGIVSSQTELKQKEKNQSHSKVIISAVFFSDKTDKKLGLESN